MTNTPGTDTAAAVDAALDELLDQLDLQHNGDGADTFRGKGSGFDEFGLYGGHVLAQAVVAAQRTVEEGRLMNSVHAVFLRGGDGMAEVDYTVDRVRDGRAFCSRRAQAHQFDRLIFELMATFHVPETGKVDIECPLPDDAPPPESLPTYQECIAEVGPIFGEQWSYMTRPWNTGWPTRRGHRRGPRHAAASTTGSGPPGDCPTIRPSTKRSSRT